MATDHEQQARAEFEAAFPGCANKRCGADYYGDDCCMAGWEAWQKARSALLAREERMREALERIAAINNQMIVPDWEEIDEARAIANVALAPIAADAQPAPVAQPVACVECGGPLQWRCPACRIAQSRAVAQPVARAKE